MSAVTAATSRSLALLTAGFIQVPADIVVSDLTLDSRAATPGAVFLACSGRTHHGLKFAAEAVSRGARAVLYEDQGMADLPQLPSGTFIAAVPKLSQRIGLIGRSLLRLAFAAADDRRDHRYQWQDHLCMVARAGT